MNRTPPISIKRHMKNEPIIAFIENVSPLFHVQSEFSFFFHKPKNELLKFSPFERLKKKDKKFNQKYYLCLLVRCFFSLFIFDTLVSSYRFDPIQTINVAHIEDVARFSVSLLVFFYYGFRKNHKNNKLLSISLLDVFFLYVIALPYEKMMKIKIKIIFFCWSMIIILKSLAAFAFNVH